MEKSVAITILTDTINKIFVASIVGSILVINSCKANEVNREITIINELNIDRKAETISLSYDDIYSLTKSKDILSVCIKDLQTEKYLKRQAIDNDLDGNFDELIFQIDIGAKSRKKYILEVCPDSAFVSTNPKITTYSRFVPERIDDFAWENDKVAFRIYGPTAQKITESGRAGGTLSSGVDCWLKKVEYPIIDKWYQKNVSEPGYYHIDHGEGYDPYHVGSSRGCGGIGIWENNTLYTSKNFIEYKIIANGPIRTIFEVSYAPYGTEDKTVIENKRISIDLGSNLSKFEVDLASNIPINDFAIGITLHKKTGEVHNSPSEGWFSLWEKIDNYYLGTAIVINLKYVNEYNDYRVSKPDESHLYVFAHPENKKLIYYAGYGWQGSPQFNTNQEWNKYLSNFSLRLSSPLIVKF